MSGYVEVVRLNLRAGVEEQRLLDAEKAVRDGMIKDQAGFRGRELLKGKDGHWMIILRFDTDKDMDQWRANLKGDPAMKAFGALLDFGTMRNESYETAIP
jgi:heme-degrading monooxygenase HmoA